MCWWFFLLLVILAFAHFAPPTSSIWNSAQQAWIGILLTNRNTTTITKFKCQTHRGPKGTGEIPPKLSEGKQQAELICSSLYSLRRIGGENAWVSPTPFGLLELNPHAEPFSPVDNSAHPGAPWNTAVVNAVYVAQARVGAKVWARVQDGDEAARNVFEAVLHITRMLLNDEARTKFLTEVQPWLDDSKQVDRICGNIWRALGWSAAAADGDCDL